MTPKQEAFVNEYLIDLNATQAAIRAGYSARTAEKIGSENLKKPDIAAALSERMKAREVRTEITQDYVLSTITETVERCKQAEPVMERGEDGKMQPTGEYKFDATNVLKGAELIGRHLGMWNDKLKLAHTFEHLSDDEIQAELAEITATSARHGASGG